MKVAVLIPTFNRLPLLREALASARAQTHRDLEILVSDDGSTDGTLEFVREESAVDPRVRLVAKNPEPGLFTNINHLLRQAAAEAYCILADDDRLLPEFVEKLLRPVINDRNVIASFCDHWVMDVGGQRLAEDSELNTRLWGRDELPPGEVLDATALALRGSMCMGFSLYRSSAFRDQPFDLACGGAADFDYAIRAASKGKLYYVAERLGEYRSHAASATSTRTDYMLRGAIHAFDKHRFDQPRYERLRREKLRYVTLAHALFASTADRRAWAASARRYLAAGGSPFNPRLVLSLLLALQPRGAAARLKAWLKRKRAQSARRLWRGSAA